MHINSINLTLGHLKQITASVKKHKEEDLAKLDSAVTEYLIKRKMAMQREGEDFRHDLEDGLCRLAASN